MRRKMTPFEKAERAAKRAARRTEAEAEAEASRRYYENVRSIVASGVCPLCGAGLRRNMALLGWWQCEQYGAPEWRKNPEAPDCGWQGFTCPM